MQCGSDVGRHTDPTNRWWSSVPVVPEYDAAVRKFERMLGLTRTDLFPNETATNFAWTYLGLGLQKTLETYAEGDGSTKNIVAKLGDEITLKGPLHAFPNATLLNRAYEQWLKESGISAPEAGCDPYEGCVFTVDIRNATENPRQFYYSSRWSNWFSVHSSHYKNVSDTVKAFQQRTGKLLNMYTAANLPPSVGWGDATGCSQCNRWNLSWGKSFVPEVTTWVHAYREGAFRLPWTEDYAFWMPTGTQQMYDLCIDTERAGVRPARSTQHRQAASPSIAALAPLQKLPDTATVPGRPIMQYVMAHDPGNTPRSHRRRFYASLAHGVKWIHLYSFEMFSSGTGDFVDGWPGSKGIGGMYAGVRQEVNELGLFDDIIAAGVPNAPGAKTALLISETSDIYQEDYTDVGAAKRSLYIMLRQSQIMLDVIIEDDVVDGHVGDYAAVYLCQRHITESAGRALARWVRDGGRLFATAGAGLANETNGTHATMAALFGVTDVAIYRAQDEMPAEIQYIKQDLQFAKLIDTVTPAAPYLHDRGVDNSTAALGVYGEVARLTLSPKPHPKDVLASFTSDGEPALFKRRRGSGIALISAFHPGFAYFAPAIPRRPVARGATDETFNHWIPTEFLVEARLLVQSAVDGVVGARPVLSSHSLVDVGVIAAAGKGTALPVVNWGPPIRSLNLTLQFDCAFANATLATGGAVEVSSVGSWVSLLLALDVADAIILR